MSCRLERLRRAGPLRGIRTLSTMLGGASLERSAPTLSHTRPETTNIGRRYPQIHARASCVLFTLQWRRVSRACCGHLKPRKSKNHTVIAPPSCSCTVSTRHAVAPSTLGGGGQKWVAALKGIGKRHVDGRLRGLWRLILRVGRVRRWCGGSGRVVIGVVDEWSVLWPLRRTL